MDLLNFSTEKNKNVHSVIIKNKVNKRGRRKNNNNNIIKLNNIKLSNFFLENKIILYS